MQKFKHILSKKNRLLGKFAYSSARSPLRGILPARLRMTSPSPHLTAFETSTEIEMLETPLEELNFSLDFYNIFLVFQMGKKKNNAKFNGRKGRHLAQKVLKKIRETRDKEKRLKIVKALARVDADWVDEVYLDLLDDPREEIRDYITKELGRRDNLDLEKVCLRLSNPLWFAKCGALRILGLQKNPDSVKFIEHSLKDRNIEVRRMCAQALGEIGGKEALGLLAKLTKDKNKFVRKAAEEALRKASHVRFS